MLRVVWCVLCCVKTNLTEMRAGCGAGGCAISWFSLVESWGRGAEGHSDAQNPPKIPH